MLKEDFVTQSNNLALLYSDRKRYADAVCELKKALRINPGYLFARINLGVVYEDQKRWKEAGREYRKILQVTPEDKHIRKRLDRISRLKGRRDGLS
ncbi:MAG TPA: tetratricopeptide repeat protein [Thermodesulfobacteriota bacterium]|nr:tetratricopeptide repeat protein [Thermodesulfobacteriota bacterium]